MKDPDSSRGNAANNDEPSLADLLGDTGGPPTDESPKRVEHRADEPDSGMVNLARMVAQSSVEIARSPSIVPPPVAPDAAQAGQPGTEGSVSGVLPVPQPAPVAARKTGGAVYALIAVVVVAAAAVALFALNREQPAPDNSAAIEAANKAAQLMAEMQAKAEADRKAAEEKERMLLAKLEEMTRTATAGGAGAVSAEDQAKMDAVKKELEAAKAEKEEAAQKASDSASSSGGGRSKSSGRAKKSDEGPAEKAAASGSGSGSSTSSVAPEKAAPKTGADELGDLLGGSKKAEEKKPAAAEAPDSVPKQPSKEQVNAAMAPIKAKAQNSCAKYSTGVVTVSVVVSGDGKVKSATPTGIFANNPAGTCVAMMARSARFPKFKDPTFTFTYPITLQ